MPTPPLPNETVELVDHAVAFQGYFRVGRYFFRHGLYQGGQSGILNLIRQFRAGAYVAGRHPWTWEIVAGILEGDESPEQLIRREAVEEAALEIRDVIPMHAVVLSPGACSETCATYLGRVDSAKAGGVYGLEAEGENILVKVLPFSEARAMLDRDEIGNAIGVIALQWLALHRDEVRARWR